MKYTVYFEDQGEAGFHYPLYLRREPCVVDSTMISYFVPL